MADTDDIERMSWADREWAERADGDLAEYWPRSILPYAWKTSHWDIQGHGYTHWWKMFNPRQLLVHTQLLRAITNAPEECWPLDVREQALGTLQQYLRNQNMFCFWDQDYDKLVPMMSNANFHPKALVVENCVFHQRGRGNWESNQTTALEGLAWAQRPWESVLLPESARGRSVRVGIDDPIKPGLCFVACASSTDLSMLGDELFDLVITDPPFGDNVNYADLADFFYVWVRIPLLLWYRGLPEWHYFSGEFSHKAIEAVINKAEHPDDREGWEKEQLIIAKIPDKVRQLTGNGEINAKDLNPLYRPEPASEFYQQTLTACWAEAGRLLRPGGLMAFTFHHNEDETWSVSSIRS